MLAFFKSLGFSLKPNVPHVECRRCGKHFQIDVLRRVTLPGEVDARSSCPACGGHDLQPRSES